MKVPALFESGKVPVLAAALLITGSGVSGQTTTGQPGSEETAERCRGAAHRAFDFWVGSWNVRNSEGELLGRNEIRRVAHGCALLENWRGAGGGQGMSINTYDSELGKWTQRWVGDGATLWLEGGVEKGRMVLAGTRNTSDGDVQDRITWAPMPDGGLSQVWEISTDGGENWQSVFVGYYSAAGRKQGAPPSGDAG